MQFCWIRLDNLIFHSEQSGMVVGVLDWELSTLGEIACVSACLTVRSIHMLCFQLSGSGICCKSILGSSGCRTFFGC